MFLRAYHMPGMALGTEDIAMHTHIHIKIPDLRKITYM